MDNDDFFKRILKTGSITIILGVALSFYFSRSSDLDNSAFLAFIGTAFSGVGCSLIASALVARIMALKPSERVLKEISGVMKQYAEFIRYDHTLELRFSKKIINSQETIILVGEHKFTFKNDQILFSKSKKIEMYTDVGRQCQNINDHEGFDSVQIDNTEYNYKKQLELEKKDMQVEKCFEKKPNGKVYFIKNVKIPRKNELRVVSRTFGIYRLEDRMVWTVQDLSKNFKVRVIDNTDCGMPFEFKINHHDEKDIHINPDVTMTHEKRRVYDIDFSTPVLPYQGFEIKWSFKSQPDLANENKNGE